MKTKYKILIHVAFWIYMFNQVILAIAMMSAKEYDPFQEITIYPITSFITFYCFYFTYALFFIRKNKLFPIILLIAVIAILIPLRVGIEYLFWKYIGYQHIKVPDSLIIDSSWWYNSGSPVLNAYGQLIGINFDRNWEGTMSDLNYDPNQCRNISLDMRYVLFIIDKFAGAKNIIHEIEIVN